MQPLSGNVHLLVYKWMMSYIHQFLFEVTIVTILVINSYEYHFSIIRGTQITMKWHDHCQYMEIPRDYSVQDLARFHGHLGPFIVLGYRIGRHALRELGGDPFSLQAEIYCSGMTPQSCLADGVQIGSGCTLGKGNIEMFRSDGVFCIFSAEGKKMKITPHAPKKFDPNDPDYELNIEQYAESLYHLPDEDLFRVDGL